MQAFRYWAWAALYACNSLRAIVSVSLIFAAPDVGGIVSDNCVSSSLRVF